MFQECFSGLLWHQCWYCGQKDLVCPLLFWRSLRLRYDSNISGPRWPAMSKRLAFEFPQDFGMDIGYQGHLSLLGAYLLSSGRGKC